ncbi:MAG: hypothetical protein H7240_03140 [Glaciimonas sp.]|nr:hypothetical protein [Glaciimonas sp.]
MTNEFILRIKPRARILRLLVSIAESKVSSRRFVIRFGDCWTRTSAAYSESANIESNPISPSISADFPLPVSFTYTSVPSSHGYGVAIVVCDGKLVTHFFTIVDRVNIIEPQFQ